MITLAPISSNIQDTLFQKMAMLSAGGNQTVSKLENGIWAPSNQIINSEVTTDGKLVTNYMNARTVWMRMTSFTPESGTKNIAVVIMGGEMGGGIGDAGQETEHTIGRMKSGFHDRIALDPSNTISTDGKINYEGLYDLKSDIPFRPIAGVKDLSVAYKGGGMKLGATRTADITWTCWNFEQLEHFTPHFLQHGKTVLLEWGWGGIGSLIDDQVYPLFKPGTLNYDDDQIIDLNEKILKHIQDQNGHYDAMLGLIQKFDWSVNDNGGFDCNTAVISPGVTLFQNQQKKLKANQFSTLPAITADKDFGQKGFLWLWDDVREVLNPDMDSIPALAPYITFQEYMNDFGQQIAFQLHSRGCIGWSPGSKEVWQQHGESYIEGTAFWQQPSHADKVAHQIIAPYSLHAWDFYLDPDVATAGMNQNLGSDDIGYKINKDGGTLKYFLDNRRFVSPTHPVQKERSDKEDKLDTPDINEAFLDYSSGAGYFVTWGWFEDNVLSRFFGNVTETDSDIKGETVTKKVIGEFRSIERKVDGDGKFEDDGDGKPQYQNIKFKNNRYLMTTDMSKWLIPNEYDPVFSKTSGLVDQWLWTDVDYMKEKNPEIFLDKDSADIRKIFFNVKYLSDKLKDSTDLIQSVGDIWNSFSSEYGGIYKFKIEYDDVGNTVCIREEGFTHPGKSVREQIEQQEKIDRGETVAIPNAFLFPTWEQNSIVKSQNINAKLPDRMQLAAMYGLNVVKEKSAKGSDRELDATSTYDDIASKAWGKFSRPLKGTEGMSTEDIKDKNYKDRISGDIDYPSRGNRSFGRYDAKINKPLVVGDRNDNNRGVWNNPGIMGEGTIIGESIKYSLEASGKMKVAQEKNDLTPGSSPDASKQEILKAGYSNFLTQMDTLNTSQSNFFNRMFYTMVSTGKKIENEEQSYRRLKSDVLFQLQALLRGHGDGVLNNTDPLIPVDFEMEIDGTGAIFPGNSFQSSYLPARYRKESIFQATGVSHKISNTEWTTTIKGQIRAMSTTNADERSAEQRESPMVLRESESGLRINTDDFGQPAVVVPIPLIDVEVAMVNPVSKESRKIYGEVFSKKGLKIAWDYWTSW